MMGNYTCFDVFTTEFEQISEEQRITWERRTPTEALSVDGSPSLGSDGSNNENELPSSGCIIASIPNTATIVAAPEPSGMTIDASPADSPFRPRAHIANSQFIAIVNLAPSMVLPGCNDLNLSFRTLPASRCRFINAIATWTFRRCDRRADTTLQVRTIGKAVDLPPILAGVGGDRAATGPSRSGCRIDDMKIDPAVDGCTPRCAWIIEGNVSSPRGVPPHSLLSVTLEQMKGSTFELELDVRGEFEFMDTRVPVGLKHGAGLVWVLDVDGSGQVSMFRKASGV
ncbi:hypothetical protein BD779DRAFT_1676877 [Infundibulicybe gibba]|nr:hypothetical protein BD779DRAFT_1676877 [Infundibulicybe gibba]